MLIKPMPNQVRDEAAAILQAFISIPEDADNIRREDYEAVRWPDGKVNGEKG